MWLGLVHLDTLPRSRGMRLQLPSLSGVQQSELPVEATFTLKVSTLSSMTSPAGCCVRVEEQAPATASTPRIAVSFRIPVLMRAS